VAIERDAHSFRLVGDTEKDWEEDGAVVRLAGFRDALRGCFEDGLGRGVGVRLEVCRRRWAEGFARVDWGVQFLVLMY
jgi:hypothetical protein